MISSRKRIYIFILIILISGIFAGNFDYPKYWNSGADALNSKFPAKFFKEKFKWASNLQFPHFPEIPFRLGLDLQGGTHLIYETDVSGIEEKDWGQSLQGLRDVIERRVNLFGVEEPVVQIEERSRRLIVELAGVKDINQAIEMIGRTPFLEFKEEKAEEETKKILDKKAEIQEKKPQTPQDLEQIQDWYLAFEDPYFKSTQLTGQYLKRARVEFDPNTNKPEIGLEFNDEGSKIFQELTRVNVGRILAIYLDQAPISTPRVQEEITGGQARITGDFTLKESQELVRNLNAGALPVPINLISQQSVEASLGKISLDKSLKAGVLGFATVALFMILFYRIPGFLSIISLGFYGAILLMLFKLVPVTLTLAGIAGFILSLGMAVDANVLIFERLREELKSGKSFGGAVSEARRRAWPSIRDGNVTTLLTCAILFGFTTSFVKGFALTLGLGVLISMFSAIVVTNLFLRAFIGTGFEKIRWLWTR